MSLRLAATIAEMRDWAASVRKDSRTIGCVPTMGALHAGHGALIDRARTAADALVVTIFVNPIQFDRKDDFESYAKNLEADRQFCEQRNVDLIFAPAVSEMYPRELDTNVDVPAIARHLCGAFRPGHFRGVATVVAKLFNIVQPDVACFGKKDLQQFAIIRRMVDDLNFPVRLIGVQTIRESDGLAMSSRNVRLTPVQRSTAPLLFRALCAGQEAVEQGETHPAEIRAAALKLLDTEPDMKVEYLEVVDARMQPLESVEGEAHLAAAVWLGSTRLIDNVLLRDS